MSAAKLFMAYFFLIVFVRNIYFLAMILEDKFSNAICGGKVSESNQECFSETKMLLLILSVCGWLVEFFFACMIFGFSEWAKWRGNFGRLDRNGVNDTESDDDYTSANTNSSQFTA